MSKHRYLGLLLVFSSTWSAAAPSSTTPPVPLVVELELAPDAQAQTTLFAIVEELGLRVPLERVREPFVCSTRYVDNQHGQAIDVACDPTQRTASSIVNYILPGHPNQLAISPRRCSEDCSRQPLPTSRHLELRLPIRGEAPPIPCPEATKTTHVDFRFERRQRVDLDSEGVLARLPFLFLTSSAPPLAIPVSWRDVRSTQCSAKPGPNQLVVTCGEQVFVAKQTGNRLSFDDGRARAGVVLPCGKRARWPTLP
jgi:hypothetical protein